MKKIAGKIIYSPSDLIVFMESEFASWMNRYHLEYPDKLKPDEADESLILLQNRGLKHEQDFLQKLNCDGKDISEIAAGPLAYKKTIEQMQAGRSIIYQACLQQDGFEGYADFLSCLSGQSRLGSYHYEVWDTKLALKPKPYFLIQLACYAEMLQEIQGRRPALVHVVLGNRQVHSFRTESYFYFYEQLKEAFLAQQRSFSPGSRPEPDGMADHGRWQGLAEQILEEMDHLSRVADIRRVAIKKLEKAGITTMKELAATEVPHVKKMLPSTLASLKQQARLQVASADRMPPLYELLGQDPDNPRRGLACLPPASRLDVAFDMEGYPHVEGGLEYLFGVAFKDNEKLEFKDWWAHDSQAERKAFEQFIDWVYARWQQDPSMHIYHYASYERTALRRLMGRYGTRENEVDALLRNEVLVDLYPIVRQGLRVGEPGYSIKNIEHLYRQARGGDVATALDSIVNYQRWLACQDGQDWQTSKILADIREYNRQDCDSTLMLADWLRQIRSTTEIRWMPPLIIEASTSESAVACRQSGQLAQQLLDTLPDAEKFPDKRSLQELFAYLLEFHRREARPLWWALFDRHQMTEEELIDDLNCLGALEATAKGKESFKRSFLYEYRFNPAQDTKLHAGEKCIFAHDLNMKATIKSLDTEEGLIMLKMGTAKAEPPRRAGLIPDEFVNAGIIAQSIYRTVLNWSQSGQLPSALADFLLKKRPRLKGNPQGPIIAAGRGQLDGAIVAVLNLDESTLCIQGPPGSGKTFTAAQAIVALLQQGARVGVSSNSHKAICNLMGKAAKVMKENGLALDAVKIGGDKDDPLFNNSAIRYARTARDVFPDKDNTPQLIGATAWGWSDQSAVAYVDYLFVDEAGQVSIANLVGMSPCTKNIVLIGDQMQLSQPIQGSHPGASGQSLLEYLLAGHQTIPDDFGIFLGTTRRMHPDVCRFISSAVYEDRLQAEEYTANRVLVLPDNPQWINKKAGIIYIPVQHEGNTQGSDEEAAVIAGVVQEIQRCRVVSDDGSSCRQLRLDDILMVAPYNMQVRKLKSLIPGARVGSVDKFQGLEAPVVIVSMCASTNEGNSRGLDFLFSKNRLNVAISRAQTLAVVVASPALAKSRCSSVNEMELVNLFCRIIKEGTA